MMMIFINAVSLIILGIIQVSFLTTWPWPISSLNLILSLIIFFVVIISYNRALGWAAGSGLFLELFSGLPFGTTTLALLLTVIVVEFLFNNFFTNRSYYSLMILGIIGSFFYNLAIIAIAGAAAIFNFAIYAGSTDYLALFFWQPMLNLLVLTIIFYTYSITTSRLKNALIFR